MSDQYCKVGTLYISSAFLNAGTQWRKAFKPMTQLEAFSIPTRVRAAEDVVNSARPRTYSVARHVVVESAAVEYKPAVSSRDYGHSSATQPHTLTLKHVNAGVCCQQRAYLSGRSDQLSGVWIYLLFSFLAHFYPPNTAIMLWTASQVLRKFSTSSVSTAALLLLLHHRMNSSFDTVTEKCCWYTLSACQVLVTSGGRSQARF